jgi:hypothetical protein
MVNLLNTGYWHESAGGRRSPGARLPPRSASAAISMCARLKRHQVTITRGVIIGGTMVITGCVREPAAPSPQWLRCIIHESPG